jgi:hypothetical protein
MTDASLFTGEEEYGMGFERASLLKDGVVVLIWFFKLGHYRRMNPLGQAGARMIQ